VHARQILWPSLAHRVVSQILTFLTSPDHVRQPVLVHGFSVGGYLYGETLVHITADDRLSESMSERIRGQVFDSPVDFDGVPRGVGMALSDLRPVQLTIRTSLEAYMGLFRRHVTTHYLESSRTFRRNPLRTPSLVLYSRSDVVGTPGPIESLISEWRGAGVPVYTHCWQNSRHVRHYLHDPVTYITALNQFLVSIGLVSDEHRQKLAMPASKL